MKDRVPLYPGRVKLVPVAGQSNVYDMERADQAAEAGTPINKASLLKDATAAALGLSAATATPDDAFRVVGEMKKNEGMVADLAGGRGHVITDDKIVPATLLYSSNDNSFVSASETKNFIIWATQSKLAVLDKRTGHFGYIDIAVYRLSPLENDLVWAGSGDSVGSLYLIDLAAGRVTKTYTLNMSIKDLAAISSTTVIVENSNNLHLRVNGAGTSYIAGRLNNGWTYRSGIFYAASDAVSNKRSMLRATISGSTITLKEEYQLANAMNTTISPLFLSDAMYVYVGVPQYNNRPYYTTAHVYKFSYAALTAPAWHVSQQVDGSDAAVRLLSDGTYLYLQPQNTATTYKYSTGGALIATLSTEYRVNSLASAFQSQYLKQGERSSIVQPWFGCDCILTAAAAAPIYSLDTFSNKDIRITILPYNEQSAIKGYSKDGILLMNESNSSKVALAHVSAKMVTGLLVGGGK